MKIKGAKQVHYDSGPNMTAMVDVVMVILVFLMLAGSFGGSWHYLTSNLPIKAKGGGGEVKPGEVQDVTLDVRIDPDPTYGFRVRCGDIATVGEAASLRNAFEQKLRAYSAIGTNPEKIQVVLSPGRSVKYQYVVEVYQQALLAEVAAPAGQDKPLKFTKVAFQASR